MLPLHRGWTHKWSQLWGALVHQRSLYMNQSLHVRPGSFPAPQRERLDFQQHVRSAGITKAQPRMQPCGVLHFALSNRRPAMYRTRLATSVSKLRHDQMEQGPTEPHAPRSMFLLSSGGAGGGHY